MKVKDNNYCLRITALSVSSFRVCVCIDVLMCMHCLFFNHWVVMHAGEGVKRLATLTPRLHKLSPSYPPMCVCVC